VEEFSVEIGDVNGVKLYDRKSGIKNKTNEKK
jgi:hypothetical protein